MPARRDDDSPVPEPFLPAAHVKTIRDMVDAELWLADVLDGVEDPTPGGWRVSASLLIDDEQRGFFALHAWPLDARGDRYDAGDAVTIDGPTLVDVRKRADIAVAQACLVLGRARG